MNSTSTEIGSNKKADYAKALLSISYKDYYAPVYE
ncbi:hypothetical protein HBNCFIEN_02890 [Legionella sp. PC997]|nr:hypothetical protein HBNCFIEN_02890 [Legionella sp. PC997]